MNKQHLLKVPKNPSERMESVLHNPNVTTAENAGPDRGILRQTWRNVILAETQLELISRLVQLNLGLPDIEEFIQNQEGKLKSSKFQKFWFLT